MLRWQVLGQREILETVLKFCYINFCRLCLRMCRHGCMNGILFNLLMA